MADRVDFISELVRGVRPQIMAAYGVVAMELKADKTSVTEIDRSVERTIVNALTAAYPDIGVMGEEHGRSGSTEEYWLIDPIDGTDAFYRGLPGPTTIIALVQHGDVTESYLYDFLADDLYHAARGKGAYRNQHQISVGARDVSSSLVIFNGSMKEQNVECMRRAKQYGFRGAKMMYGGGARGIYIATGKADAMVIFQTRGHVWDYAPGIMLAQEAGATFVPLDDSPVGEGPYILASPQTISDVEAVVQGL